MKVILQQVDTTNVVKIIFYNNTPNIEHILKNSIGKESITYNVPDFMTDVIKQAELETLDNLIIIQPGQTFTNLTTMEKFHTKDEETILTYVHYQPLYNDGFLYLVKSLPIHFIAE
jgi:hypothetical protein